MLPGPVHGRLKSGYFLRRRMTEMCAIVNESIAPKAYMLPRNTAWPGIIARHAIAPKSRIPIHGVP